MKFQFALLGVVAAWRDGEIVDTGTRQQQAVLAALLLNAGRQVSAQRLIDGLWGEEPPATASATLRTYVSRIRELLGQDRAALVSEAGGYALRVPPESVDALEFEALAERAEQARAAGEPERARRLLADAMELWNGEALSGVPGPYAEAQRARLGERRLAVLEAGLAIDLELGRHAETVGELGSLVGEFPFRERLRALLMLALYRSGRQAEALAVYTGARRLLADELGVDPGAELAELHVQILRGDPGLSAVAAAVPDGRLWPRPAQLPAEAAWFTGRAGQVAALREMLSPGSRTAVVVSSVAGIAGVGKTALAVYMARAMREHYPDGQLYVDLMGTGEAPVDASTVLGSFLHALGLDDSQIPDTEAERSSLYRSVLTDRRVLVLLDNARSSAQVRPLLPGSAGCAVLVTSRARLSDLPGAHHVGVDVMEMAEALDLLALVVGETRVSAERDAARNVVVACGFLPLAIRIVAGRLAARPGWSIASVAERLSDERRRLAELRVGSLDVEASFELGYRQLDKLQADAFVRLAQPDCPDLSLPAAAAVLGMDETDAEDVIESLVDLNLVESPVAGRYRLHDLIRLYARQRGQPDGELPRLLAFYLATARNAQPLLTPGDGRVDNLLRPVTGSGLEFAGSEEAQTWLFGEIGCLFETIVQASRGSQELLAGAADLLLMISGLLDSALYGKVSERVAQAVVEGARRHGDVAVETRAFLQLGWHYYYLSRFEESAAACRTTLSLALSVGDLWAAADARARLGCCVYHQHRYEEAVGHFAGALEDYGTVDDRYAVADSLGLLARAYLALGRKDEALVAAERSTEVLRELGLADAAKYALYQHGIVLRGVGRPDEAIATLTRTLEIFRARRNTLWEGLTLFRMAEAQLDAGRFEQAVSLGEQALAILREVGDVLFQGHALTVLGHAHAGGGDRDVARGFWEEALRAFEKTGVPEASELRALLDGPSHGPSL